MLQVSFRGIVASVKEWKSANIFLNDLPERNYWVSLCNFGRIRIAGKKKLWSTGDEIEVDGTKGVVTVFKNL